MSKYKYFLRTILLFLVSGFISCFFVVHAQTALPQSSSDHVDNIDRVQLVNQQIKLLKYRLDRSKQELAELEKNSDAPIAQEVMEKASKNILDKAALDISVAQSNLDSINIEVADAKQRINWLDKNCQEISSQLNVLNMFGLKIARKEMMDVAGLRADLQYEKQLLGLEKDRAQYLQTLQEVAKRQLSVKKEAYTKLGNLLKSRKMLHLKQQQMQDELAYQQQQNVWLQQLNILYSRLAKADPLKNKKEYVQLERHIFYANERANEAYVQSLIARYKDQIQQMKLVISREGSISVLNELADQIQSLAKQIERLDTVLKSRMEVLEKHTTYLSHRKSAISLQEYLANLKNINVRYQASENALTELNKNIVSLRAGLDQSIQAELASRQGVLSFGPKMLLDLGKEMLLVPALAFQMVLSLSSQLMKGIAATSLLGWAMFGLIEIAMFFAFIFIYKILKMVLDRPLAWKDKMSAKWLALQWLKRHCIDWFLIANLIGTLLFFGLTLQSFLSVIYLALVWLIFKSIMTVARLSLVETTYDANSHDIRLFRRLRWMILIGGVITAITVFVNQLPLIYEIKALCDWLFLCLLMIVSILLLRSWQVIPNLILSQMESQHPYLERSIRLMCVLIPIIMLGNSIMGLIGFINLIKTVAWYEAVFLIVLVGYLILRGLLSDGIEWLSRFMIQYMHNGWLWTEAFLKPLNTVLRILFFFSAWAVLFLLYGWDHQSPIIERLNRLLNFQLVSVLGKPITPISILELLLVISVFYWSAKWTREFVYRLLANRTRDMGVRNSIAILSQYCVMIVGALMGLRVLGIGLQALTYVAGALAVVLGLGLKDLISNFACGFLILLERPLRVGDIVNINNVEGEVTHIGGRAVTVRTWDHMELVVPNAEIFNKSFTNWTAKDNIVRCVAGIKIGRCDNPHEVTILIQTVLASHQDVLKEPVPEVYLRDMTDTLLEFELRFFVNVRQVKSRISVTSAILMAIWDKFVQHGIKPPYPQQEILLRSDALNTPLVNVSKP